MYLKAWVSVLSLILVYPTLIWYFTEDLKSFRIVSQDKNIVSDFDTWHKLSDTRFVFNAYVDDRQVPLPYAQVLEISNGD